MCGIICILSNCDQNNDLCSELEKYKHNISKRGPNSFDTTSYKTDNYNLLFASSVLWLQGKHLTKQPLENNKSILVYNGDIFGGNISDDDRRNVGDTILFLNELESSDDNLSRTLSNIQGPYAFIYLNKSTSKLYFGRDIYGRRSLLIGVKSNNTLILTSVAGAERDRTISFIELPSIGIFCYDLKTKTIELYSWQQTNYNKLEELKTFLKKDILVKDDLITNEQENNFVPPNQSDLVLFESLKNRTKEEIFNILLNNSEWLNRLVHLKDLLEVSVEKRVLIQQTNCRACIKNSSSNCNHSTVGVLFSGGVDCSILTLLADKFVDQNRPIDLINIAFDSKSIDEYRTPDRLSAGESLRELKTLCPQRQWNFIEVDITKEELDYYRTNYIARLIYPLNTILDDSLGCALWFASRGMSGLESSTAHILLVGMGADELFGGYSKHRIAFKNQQWEGLHKKIVEDWLNLPYRNLGRDDRVVSDNGKQLRTPYLDENVAEFVKNLNVWEKTCPFSDIPQGVGDKLLLRSLAYYLGLKNVATFKKRALQFGSKIAISKQKAHEISVHLIT